MAPQYSVPQENPLLIPVGDDGGCEGVPGAGGLFLGSSFDEIIPGVTDFGIFGATDSRTGKVVWKVNVAQPAKSGMLVAGNLVFFGEGNGNFHALDATTGENLFTFDGSSVPHGGGAFSEDSIARPLLSRKVRPLRVFAAQRDVRTRHTLECLMELAESEWAALVNHSSTASHATNGIDAHARIGESGTLLFRYVLRAEISRVRLPPAKSAERADGLWKHTCFEAFVKVPAAVSYYELNFAPSRQWAVYRFNAYREGISSPGLASPEISVRRFDDRLEIDAAVRLHDLIGLQSASHLQVGLSAVVEEESGTLSYWALKHGPGKADFHCPDGFLLELKI